MGYTFGMGREERADKVEKSSPRFHILKMLEELPPGKLLSVGDMAFALQQRHFRKRDLITLRGQVRAVLVTLTQTKDVVQGDLEERSANSTVGFRLTEKGRAQLPT